MSVSPAVRIAGLVVAAGRDRLLGPKDAGGLRLLGPVDLDVARGEHVLLVGPSGSGKTTLLRAVAGLVAPAEGEIDLFGAPASRPGRLLVPPERRGVGMLFQGGALWPHMDVARTLRFARKRAGLGDVEARTRELVERMELGGLEDRLPGTLSGGEKQRLALARALSTEPRLVLLDEPLGPLDAELRTELLARLVRLHRELGWTTIHVTHDPAEARAAASRVLRLEDGLLVDHEPTPPDAARPAPPAATEGGA